MNFLKLDLDIVWQPFNTLSGGERTKLLLALAFSNSNCFQLIDEPTNRLDEESRNQVANYLNQRKSGFIVVSHDRAFLNQVTDHTLAIENAEINLYQGNFAVYEDNKNKRDHFNIAKNEKLHREITSLNQSRQQLKRFGIESEKKNPKALDYRSAKLMRRSKNAERRMNKGISERQGLMKNIDKAPELTMNFKEDYHHLLLNVNHFSMKIENRQLFEDLNLKVNNHEIVSLEGRNGSGKSGVLKIIQGLNDQYTYSGTLSLVEGLKISYLPQNFVKYHGKLKEFAEKQKIEYETLLNNLKKMGFARDAFEIPIEKMSMGQQKRVALAKSLSEEANLYLWGEPANYLDVFNQDQLIKLLKNDKPAMLLIEHDEYFLKQVANTRISILSKETPKQN